jgi:hypothetical protein
MLGVPRDLDWRGGAGLLYIIDLAKPFSPEASSWQSIESEGQSRTFGESAVDESHIYVRSQRELVKVVR